MTGNDVTITGGVRVTNYDDGALEIWDMKAFHGFDLEPRFAAALREHFVAVRMPEDVAEPSADRLREIARNATGTGYYSGGMRALRAVWRAALEAAYSQKGAVDDPR